MVHGYLIDEIGQLRDKRDKHNHAGRAGQVKMKSTFHKCQMCKVPFDVGCRPDKLYCDICKRVRERNRKKKALVTPTVKTCRFCGLELLTANNNKIYHTACKRKADNQRILEYKRGKNGVQTRNS